MRKVDVIIPCYGSEHTISAVVSGINESIGTDNDVRIMLVNDCSPDGVWNEIKKLCEEYKNVTGINLSRNFGQQSARMAAMSYVEGDYVVFMDDDGQHDTSIIPHMLKKMEEGYDIVYAAFESKKQAKWKTLGSNFHQRTAEWFEEKPKGVKTSSFFVVKRYIIDELKKYPSPSPVIFGYLMKTTQNIANVPAQHKSRIHGSSGYSLKKLMKLWFNAISSFSVVPLQFSSYLGFISSLIGLLTFVVIIIRKLITPEITAGYTSTIAVILLFSGIVLLMMGLMGEYIARMFMTINCVPQYVIKEVVQNREDK